jgi:hypothetical protein
VGKQATRLTQLRNRHVASQTHCELPIGTVSHTTGASLSTPPPLLPPSTRCVAGLGPLTTRPSTLDRLRLSDETSTLHLPSSRQRIPLEFTIRYDATAPYASSLRIGAHDRLLLQHHRTTAQSMER